MCNALPNFVHKDVLPPEIFDKKPEVAAVAEESDEPEANGEVEEPEVPDEAAEMGAAFLDAFGILPKSGYSARGIPWNCTKISMFCKG